MSKNYYLILLISAFLFLSYFQTFAQETDIVPYLKQVEKGEKEKATEALPKLLKDHPNDPSVIFLQGVLTENGQEAVSIYNKIIKHYPKSKYADAALYRIYTYYYALGMYNIAEEELKKLKHDYPDSPYLEIANKNVPKKNNVIAKVSTPDSVKTEVTPKKENKQAEQYKYTIQAGAFSVQANAEALVKSFKASGYFSKIEEKTIAATTFHVVYVGQFTNEDDAKKMLQLINSKYNLDGRVISTNN